MAQLDVVDLVVEVRDRDLIRTGQIDEQFLNDAIFAPRPNGVGTWTLELPAYVDGVPYARCAELREPGAGIIVTTPGPDGADPEVFISGPVDYANCESDEDDPHGVWTFTGVSDEIHIGDNLSYPSPAVANAAAQTAANDTRTGNVETLIRTYVDVNIGPTAPAARKTGSLLTKIVTTANGNRGPSRTTSPRFQNLLELSQQITAGTDVIFRLIQDVDDNLALTFSTAQDLSDLYVLDVENDQLDSTQHGYGAPGLTRAIVAGQDQGVSRQIVVRTSADSLAAELAYGRRREVFIDQRQTAVVAELEQAGDRELEESAAPSGFRVNVSSDLGTDFATPSMLGALVSVVIGDNPPIIARINQLILTVKPDGIYVGAVVGDEDGTDWEGQVNRSITTLRTRVSSLERNTGSRGTSAQRDATFGVPTTDAARAALANQQAVWFNTEKGYAETYYATTGLAGLVARGLVAGYASGWYPVPGSFLTCTRIKTNGFQAHPAGTVLPSLISPALVNIGGFTMSVANGIIPPVAGYYDITSSIYWSGGGAMAYLICAVYYTGGAEIGSARIPGNAVDMQTGIALDGVLIPAGQAVSIVSAAAAPTNIYGDGINRRTFLSLKYAGPPLVNY